MSTKLTHAARMTALALAVAAGGAAHAGAYTGPSSSQSPYVVPSTGVDVISILTVGDSVNNKPDGSPYRLVGIPDGMGAYDNNDGTFTLLVNHEIGNTLGVARAHGQTGAFVSEWVIRKSDLSVVRGSDLIQRIVFDKTPEDGTLTLGRLCSADLPAVSAFFNASSGLGTQNRIFMSGEEVGAEGRVFGHVATGTDRGTSYELPYLGKFSWENSVANPHAQDKTVVIGLDDTTPGQLYVYVGDKRAAGNDVEKAGLVGGSLFGIKVNGITLEDRTAGISDGTAFTLQNFGDVSGLTGAALQSSSVASGVTEFLRPEDGAWNPLNPNEFFFVTTDRFETASQQGESRLFRLRFADITNPTLGGTIDQLLNGDEMGLQMLDNLAVDLDGNVIIQEDPGNQDYLARTWMYDPDTEALTQLLVSDPARFAPGAPGFLTRDEENSGVIDVTALMDGNKGCSVSGGTRCYIGNTQAHYAISGELVEGGQIYLTRVPEPSTLGMMLGGVGLLGLLRRRSRRV